MTAIESEVVEVLDRLHRAKSQAYGDAWRKRGEVLSIFCNIARKYDRLQVGTDGAEATTAETELDTVADLAVYACKYVTWLAETQPESFDGLDLNTGLLSAARGDDALEEALSSISALASTAEDEGVARYGVETNFRSIERTLIAASEGVALDTQARASKVRHAVGLAESSLQLVFALARVDTTWRTTLESELA